MQITKKITTLKDYLYFNQITYQAFAQKCGMNASMIGNFCNGKTIPKHKTAEILEEATNGVISAESLVRFSFEKKMSIWLEKRKKKSSS